MADKAENVRHRFTVPANDTVVNEWIEAQSNLGFSLRVLIKAFVRDQGVIDATCLALGQPVKRRGRPTKESKLEMQNVGMENMIPPSQAVGSDYDDIEDESSIEKQVQSTIQPVTQVKYTPEPKVVEPKTNPVDEDDALASLLG